jgi:sRNA-binding protein
MATQGASAKKHATKPKAEKPKAEKPKAEKPKAEKPKAEKPKAEPKEKTTPPAEKTPKTKQTTVWDILLLGKKNKHGKYVTYKSINQTIFEPATEEHLQDLCEAQDLHPETTEELVKALDSLGL